MSCPNYLITLIFASCAACADGEQQFANIDDFALVSGGVIEDCQIGFRVLGELNADKSNVLVMPTWHTGTSAQLIDTGIIGPGKLADTDIYYVIAFDALANGVSSSPSNSASQRGDDFPQISIEDMVRTQHKVLAEQLGIEHINAIVGISMGGMQTFQWMTSFPKFMDKAVPLDGSPKMTSYDIIQWQTHKDVIEVMQNSAYNNSEIMEIVSPLGLLTLWTRDYIVENIAAVNLGEFLVESFEGYEEIDSYDYVSQLEAMMSVDLLGSTEGSRRRFAESVKADVLVVAVPTDHMVNPDNGKVAAGLIGADYLAIESNCGHMGTTCEAELVATHVNAFLKRP